MNYKIEYHYTCHLCTKKKNTLFKMNTHDLILVATCTKSIFNVYTLRPKLNGGI